MGKRFTQFLIVIVVCIFAASAYASYTTKLVGATKNGRLFNFETWDAQIIWHATFFSDEFRSAYEEKSAKINHFDETEKAQFISEEERRQSSGWDFFVSFYTKKEYKKFSTEHDSFWKIRMITASGEVVKPLEIEVINITPYEKIMFHHLNRWSRAYRVTFPKVDLGDEFTLTIDSVVGESTLKWKVK